MKRSTLIFVCGFVLIAVGYFGFQPLFRHLQQSRSGEHLKVSTSDATAVHIATRDPQTNVLVYEDEGGLSVIVTKMESSGDYADTRIWARRSDSNLGLQLSRRRNGVVTVLKELDADGLPIQKAVRTKEGVRSYSRQPVEWIEQSRSAKEPNQTPDPTATSGRGSP